MKPENESSASGGKRISFLMPYIDFCFMLIIIFVGMLSIAYFDPAGLTDMFVRADDQINQSVGEYENAPRGVERRAHGTGGEESEGTPRPLIGKDFSGGAVYPAPAPPPDASTEFPTPDSVREPMPYNPPRAGQTGAASQAELDAMRRRLERLQSENRRLRNTQPASQPRGSGTGARTQPPASAPAQASPAPSTAQPPQGAQPQTPPAPQPDKGMSDHLYLDLGGSR
jgi:hypothetical protein